VVLNLEAELSHGRLEQVAGAVAQCCIEFGWS